MAYYGEIKEAPDVQIEPCWKCYHCGTTGDDEDGMNAATYVTETPQDSANPVWVYWRPHCDTCLLRPATAEFPPGWSQIKQVPQWRMYRAAAGDRLLALRDAVERHGRLQAKVAGALHCSVCMKRWTTGRLDPIFGLVYAVEADRDEHPCIECIDRLPQAEVRRAHQARSVVGR
ncbi:hypothetical protein [Streptomyces longispororuber]|uniref:hypothetical protein n=1 Tax=Streptomyces longispororuber TaxID=68230 RepID=UPI0036FDF2CD